MCNGLPEIMKNGDAGIFPVYYSLKKKIVLYFTKLLFVVDSTTVDCKSCCCSKGKIAKKYNESEVGY